MTSDILFLFAMVVAVIKGFTKGFVVGLFSFVAYYVGLAAALKLSVVVANYLSKGDSGYSLWLPVFSFLLVFVGVVIAVNLIGKLIKSVVTFSTLGWLDKLGGILFFVIIYLFIFSFLVFYAVKVSLFSQETLASSRVYSLIEPVAPGMVDFLGKALPFFRNMFNDLQSFFGSFAG